MVYSNYVICRWSAIWNRAFSFQANATHEFSQWVFKIQSQCYIISLDIHMLYVHWRQTGLKSGGAEWEFETYLVKFDTYLVKFETYSVIRDYETKKTAGAPEPPSLAPMAILNIE